MAKNFGCEIIDGEIVREHQTRERPAMIPRSLVWPGID